MMTVGTTNTGEAFLQVAALEIVMDYFSYGRPIKAVLFGKLLVIIQDKSGEMFTQKMP